MKIENCIGACIVILMSWIGTGWAIAYQKIGEVGPVYLLLTGFIVALWFDTVVGHRFGSKQEVFKFNLISQFISHLDNPHCLKRHAIKGKHLAQGC